MGNDKLKKGGIGKDSYAKVTATWEIPDLWVKISLLKGETCFIVSTFV